MPPREHCIIRDMRAGLRPIHHLEKLASILPCETRYFLPTRVWAIVADDVEREAQYSWSKTHPGEIPPRCTPQNFNALRVGRLLVLNATTDDQEVCDWLNEPEARHADFQNRALGLRVERPFIEWQEMPVAGRLDTTLPTDVS